jgi:hypothetical protein
MARENSLKAIALKDRIIARSAFPEHMKNVALVEQHYDHVYKKLREEEKKHADSAKQFSEMTALLQTEMPQKGWYLTGKETNRSHVVLAKHLKDGDWEAVDEIMVAQAMRLPINVDKLAKWLADHNVPEYTIDRLRGFMRHFKAKHHDEATALGVPLIDEICRLLYEGRDFTTKGKGKHKKCRPAISEPKKDGTQSVKSYASGFLRQFGLFQKDWDATTDFGAEDYFNRHAILHGKMQRAYGPKDSAKTFMAIMFICTAFNE